VISVISVVSNAQYAKECLLRALNRQKNKFELLIVDNTTGTFSSAAQAYNSAVSKTSGDYLVFVHQDVFFPDINWIKQIEDQMSTIPDKAIAGIAGMQKPTYLNQLEIWLRYFLQIKIRNGGLWYSRYGRGNLLMGKNCAQWPGKIITEPVPVQTVDELLLVIPQRVFGANKFDQKTCDGWHLYGIDFCLSASKKGFSTYVLPAQVIHYSEGKIDRQYRQILQKLLEKHEGESIINTTCGLYPTKKEMVDLFWEPQHNFIPHLRKNGPKSVFDFLTMLWTF
jgi:glycosyltransferase involved in cell wall biosynthesis